jgi:hypothetical protein
MFVSHAIYLSQQERKQLNEDICAIETKGVCNVTASSDGKTEEMICVYLITNEESPVIELMPDGFKIYISPKQCKELLPLPVGIEWLNFKVDQDVKGVNVHHQVVFQTIDVLEQTTAVVEFAASPASGTKVAQASANGGK